jgi:hypothetical protein
MGEQHSDRPAGAWIGQQPDENTERVERTLDDGAERTAVTNNEAEESGAQQDVPQGHREPSSET